LCIEYLDKKPDWVKKKIRLNNANIDEVKNLLDNSHLHTVCQSAMCPNIFECFSKKTATFMIMGDICTRNCSFCGVKKGKPGELDENEPENIAKAAKEMGLNYIVVTSVTRDDLPDGGAGHFAKTIRKIKKLIPGSKVECLIPDFNGNIDNLKVVLEQDLVVLNHNVETIYRNYPVVRGKADYRTSLNILSSSKKIKPEIYTKSGFMLGLGESREEIIELLSDIKKTGCDIITIGQYLRPSPANTPVQKYYTPQEFEEIKDIAKSFKFKAAASGVFVRSSHNADSILKKAVEAN